MAVRPAFFTPERFLIGPVLSPLPRRAAVIASMACALPQVFIARQRLETARNLLETGRQPIKEIAVQSEYLDEGSFRRFAGMTRSSKSRRAASLG